MNRHLLFPIILVYCVISGLVGVSIVSAIITSILVLLLEYYKLAKSDDSTTQHVLQSHKTSIIAHRGCGHDGPENTLAAIKEAKKNGVDAVEFDLEFSKDGVALLLHDNTLDRTTDGEGEVGKLTFKELQNLDASCKHPLKSKFPNERMPSLDDAINLCLAEGLKMYIDVKGGSNMKMIIDTLTSVFKKYPDLYSNAIVCSFWPQIPYLVKKADPKIVTGLTHRHKVLTRKVDGTERSGPLYKRLIYPVLDVILEWSMHSWLWYLCGSSAFLMFVEDVSLQKVQRFKSIGIDVIVWTPNSNIEKNYVKNILKCSYITDTMKPEGGQPQIT